MNDDTAAETDPWEPADPDEVPDPGALLAYWKTANESPAAQRQLVSDKWRLWRLARDMAGALDDLLSRAPRPVSFRDWLRQFRRDESALGDLARDVLADPDWPRATGSLARYSAHLEDRGASDVAVAALRETWARYESEREP